MYDSSQHEYFWLQMAIDIYTTVSGCPEGTKNKPSEKRRSPYNYSSKYCIEIGQDGHRGNASDKVMRQPVRTGHDKLLQKVNESLTNVQDNSFAYCVNIPVQLGISV